MCVNRALWWTGVQRIVPSPHLVPSVSRKDSGLTAILIGMKHLLNLSAKKKQKFLVYILAIYIIYLLSS